MLSDLAISMMWHTTWLVTASVPMVSTNDLAAHAEADGAMQVRAEARVGTFFGRPAAKM